MKLPLRWLSADSQAAFLAEGTNAFRLADSPTTWIEKFGEALLFSTTQHGWDLQDVERFVRRAGCSESHIFFRKMVHSPGAESRPWRVAGTGEARAIAAQEAGVRFLLDFESGYNCGLFLDQRANRKRLRALAPRRVLNLFAYTCSFSLFAALAGAETTNVDLSKTALTRGRNAFSLNGLSESLHRFFADDVFDTLPRLARRGEKFDAIIIDPPTFSRGRGRQIFRVTEDLAPLSRLALACAESGAHILLSSNASSLSLHHLRAIAQSLNAQELHVEPPLPDIPPARAAKTLWFRAP